MKEYCRNCGAGTSYVNLRKPIFCHKCNVRLDGVAVAKNVSVYNMNYPALEPTQQSEPPQYSISSNRFLRNLTPISMEELGISSDSANESIKFSDILSSKKEEFFQNQPQEERPREEIVESAEPTPKKRGRKPKPKVAKLRKGKSEKQVLEDFFGTPSDAVSDSER